MRLVIDVDEVAVGQLLAHHGLLPHYGTDDRAALHAAWREYIAEHPDEVNEAFCEFIARLIAKDAEQHGG